MPLPAAAAAECMAAASPVLAALDAARTATERGLHCLSCLDAGGQQQLEAAVADLVSMLLDSMLMVLLVVVVMFDGNVIMIMMLSRAPLRFVQTLADRTVIVYSLVSAHSYHH